MVKISKISAEDWKINGKNYLLQLLVLPVEQEDKQIKNQGKDKILSTQRTGLPGQRNIQLKTFIHFFFVTQNNFLITCLML